MGLYHLSIAVAFLLSPLGNAYVTTADYKYVSIPAMFGKSFKGAIVGANLYLPPQDLDFELCTTYSDDESDRRSLADASVLRYDDLLTTDKPAGFLRKRLTQDKEIFQLIQDHPSKLKRQTEMQESIALLVKRGNCEFVTKAFNAMKLNDLWSNEGGPRIEYMIIQNYDSVRDYPVEMDAFDEKSDEVTLGIVSIGNSAGKNIINRSMPKLYSSLSGESNENFSMYLNSASFMSVDNENRNQWTFPVAIDGVYLYQDIASRSNNITIVFLVVAISIPFIRGIMVFFMLNRDFRLRRSERGFITGITWTRIMPDRRPPTVRESVMSIWASYQKNTLTEEEVKNLPTVEYGISDLKETIQVFRDNNCKQKKDKDECKETKKDEVNEECDLSLTSSSSQDDSEEKDTVGPHKSFLDGAYASCISCPVCLCDFEHGEEVKLLPKCGHLFHSDCIMPWLTEKKGSCPLCQTDVLDKDDDSEE